MTVVTGYSKNDGATHAATILQQASMAKRKQCDTVASHASKHANRMMQAY
jgi:hypothetical protein